MENTVPHTNYTSVLPGYPYMASECQKGRTISISPVILNWIDQSTIHVHDPFLLDRAKSCRISQDTSRQLQITYLAYLKFYLIFLPNPIEDNLASKEKAWRIGEKKKSVFDSGNLRNSTNLFIYLFLFTNLLFLYYLSVLQTVLLILGILTKWGTVIRILQQC